MKKSYVAPESRLITISLDENIAYSSGVDEVGGTISILFTDEIDGCRGKYTDLIEVKTAGTDFLDYYDDFNNLVASTQNFMAWFNCFKRKPL